MGVWGWLGARAVPHLLAAVCPLRPGLGQTAQPQTPSLAGDCGSKTSHPLVSPNLCQRSQGPAWPVGVRAVCRLRVPGVEWECGGGVCSGCRKEQLLS